MNRAEEPSEAEKRYAALARKRENEKIELKLLREIVSEGCSIDGTPAWEGGIRCIACGGYSGLPGGDTAHESNCAWIKLQALRGKKS